MRLLWPFTIPGAAASAQRHDYLVAPPGTLTLAAHPMALPAASRSALTTPPIDTLSPLAPDTAWPYDEAMSYVELNMKPPRAYARGILHFFCAIRRSTFLRSPSFGGSPLAHSSMDLRPWSSAKADKKWLGYKAQEYT